MITKSGLLLIGMLCVAWPALASREAFDTRAAATPLNAIEPASGDSAPAEGHSEAAAKPEAHGSSEGAAAGTSSTTASSGKKLDGPPPLPQVKIGGQPVARAAAILEAAEKNALPKDLARTIPAQQLRQRMAVTPYAHSPRLGPLDARISVVVFEDLGCVSCTTASKEVSAVLEPLMTAIMTPVTSSETTAVSASTQIIWVHAPASRWQGSNLAAFYSKVAARQGSFWNYRTRLLESEARDASTLFALLSEQGMEPRAVRAMTTSEARRFYRELDGDAQLARVFGVSSSPVVMVNGIRVGQHGIPLNLLADVLAYVHNRIEAGLDEPPL